MHKVAAVILNYNSSEDSEKCIGYLLLQDYKYMDIVIIDNGSNPIEKKKIEDVCQKAKLTLICNNENKGFSAGNNIGIKYSIKLGAEAILIINPDVELRDKKYISIITKALFNNDQVVVAGSDIIDAEGNHQNPLRELNYWEDLFWLIDILCKKLFFWHGYIDYNSNGFVEKLTGCCIILKSTFLEKIGYLDEGVFLYCEEPILAKAVQMRNQKMLYCNETIAYHMHIASQKGSSKLRLMKMIDSRKYYLEKYSGYHGLALKMLLTSRNLQRKFYELTKR
jgi:GT2 family glycosyltransferase